MHNGWRWKVLLRAAGLLLVPLAVHAQDDLGEDPPPKRWSDVGARYQSECPSPMFTLEKPETLSALGQSFEVRGSTMVRQGGPWKGPLRIGVLGAIKDATKETRENIRKAAAEFRKRKVDLVISNGDISEGEFDLEDAFMMLGEEVPFPVLLHIGNSEGKGSFSRAYLKAQKVHPHLFNMNWIRHVDWGGVHVVAMPGYFNQKFLHGKAGCHYKDNHVRELKALIKTLPTTDTVILTAHGPPLSFGKDGIDVAHDAGNVGDPALAALLEDANIPLGIFGHILEAGGRATSDLKRGTPQKLPMKAPVEPLYVNVGSACASPWAMLGGKQSYGMAAVVSLENRRSTVDFITLRKGG